VRLVDHIFLVRTDNGRESHDDPRTRPELHIEPSHADQRTSSISIAPGNSTISTGKLSADRRQFGPASSAELAPTLRYTDTFRTWHGG
jgi:hypothetical protein